jgi:S1/P1 Nuclease
LLKDMNRNPGALAAELEEQITPQGPAEWVKASIEHWPSKATVWHSRSHTAILPAGDPAAITSAYERRADPVVKLQLEKTGIRLVDVLNSTLK